MFLNFAFFVLTYKGKVEVLRSEEGLVYLCSPAVGEERSRRVFFLSRAVGGGEYGEADLGITFSLEGPWGSRLRRMEERGKGGGGKV